MLAPDDYLTAQDMGLEPLTYFVSVNVAASETPGHVEAAAQWWEYLAFHRDRRPEMFDGDGWLTDEAGAILARIAAERYGVEVDWAGNYGGDDPHVTFLWWADVSASASAGDVGEAIYDTAAHISNETDPGTFYSPYLFDDVARELARAADDDVREES